MEDPEPYGGNPVDNSTASDTVSKERRAELEAAGYARLKDLSEAIIGGRENVRTSLLVAQALNHASLEERAIYERFQRVHSWIIGIRSDVSTRCATMHQAFSLISNFVNEAIICEGFVGFQEKLPVLMSGKDFISTRKKTVESYLTKNGEEIPQSVFDLFIIAVEYWLAHLKKHPAASNPLKALQEQYQIEQVKSSFILEKWNRANKNGFYVLASGLKSGIMTREEFDKFLVKEEQLDLDDIIKNHFGHGVSDLETALQHDRESIKGIKWHIATGKPRSAVKKWQAIHVLNNLYGGQIGVEDMVNEFPGLVEAISVQAEKDFKIDLASVPIGDWKKPFTTRRKLYEMDFYLQRRRAETFYKNGVKTAVAVVQDEWDAPTDGYYDRPDSTIYIESSLEGFTKDSERLERLNSAKYIVEDCYYFIRGFACALNLIAEILDLPGFKRFAVPTVNLDRTLNAIRAEIETLYETVRKLPPGEKRLQKLRVLKDHFLLPDWEKVEVPRENIRKARKLIKSLDAFQPGHFTEFYSLLLRCPTHKDDFLP